MQNLIGNAIKYRNKDVGLKVQINCSLRGEVAIFCIRDNGIGIKPEYWQTIFEPFKRLHDNSKYPGTGMGLAICRKIVEGWSGRLWVDSVVGEYTAFYFSFPLRKNGKSGADA